MRWPGVSLRDHLYGRGHLEVLLARDNPTLGHRRIQGEPAWLGYAIAASTVWEILHAADIEPVPRRAG